jgi:hypothetical protein
MDQHSSRQRRWNVPEWNPNRGQRILSHVRGDDAVLSAILSSEKQIVDAISRDDFYDHSKCTGVMLFRSPRMFRAGALVDRGLRFIANNGCRERENL